MNRTFALRSIAGLHTNEVPALYIDGPNGDMGARRNPNRRGQVRYKLAFYNIDGWCIRPALDRIVDDIKMLQNVDDVYIHHSQELGHTNRGPGRRYWSIIVWFSGRSDGRNEPVVLPIV